MDNSQNHLEKISTPYSVLREKIRELVRNPNLWCDTVTIMSHIDEYRENIAVEFEEKIRFSIRERASVWQKAATIIRRT